MEDERKTKQQLMNELAEMRQRVAELEASEAERKRAEEEIRLRTAQLEALRQVGLEITADLDLDSLLHSIVSRAVELVGGDSGGLYLYRPEEDVLEWAMTVGSNLAPLGTTLQRGEGLSGKVWEMGEPLIVDDYGQWGGRADVYAGYPWTATVGVPVRWGERFLGVLNVLADVPYAFSPADAELLILFATQAAIAIRNARLYESERRHSAELEVLHEASLHLTSTLELQPVLETILDYALELVSAYDAHVFLYDGQRLTFGAALWEDGRQQEPYAEPRPQGLTYAVAHSGERIVIPDVNSHPLFGDYQWGGSIVGLPLLVSDQVVGVMNVAFQRPHAFDESELRVLELLADQAAIAIQNARLFEETERLKAFNESVVQGVAEAILIEDAQGMFTFANPAAEELLGYTSEELIGQHWTTVVPEDEQQRVRHELSKRPHKIASRYEAALLSKEGQVIPVLVSARPLFEGGQFVGVLTAFTDITELKRAEEKLAHMATHDTLTGVRNRLGFFTLAEQQLKMADRTGARVSLLFADFDHLKRINDSFGHREGDRALVEAARILKETFRDSDIVGRIAGDEFVILATEADKASAEVLSARLQDNLEARNAEGDLSYELSLSVGLARYDPENPCSIEELVARADKAMYKKKKQPPRQSRTG